MWISHKLTTPSHGDGIVDTGTVTISGISPSVFARGEQRELPLFAPYGILWQPAVGDSVLVLTDSADEPCIVAAHDEAPPCALAPHELLLYGNGCSIHLKANGSIVLQGNIQIQGNLIINGSPFDPNLAT